MIAQNRSLPTLLAAERRRAWRASNPLLALAAAPGLGGTLDGPSVLRVLRWLPRARWKGHGRCLRRAASGRYALPWACRVACRTRRRTWRPALSKRLAPPTLASVRRLSALRLDGT